MLSGRWVRRAAASCQVAAMLAVAAAAAHAQATSQIPLQFSFMTPGARSLALGGAFLGAADDATAASANPSGLALLSLREISVEGRVERIETPFLQGGRIAGSVTGEGLDTIDGPSYGTDTNRHAALTFVSLVVPLGRATVAAYSHQVASMTNRFFSQGVFQRGTLAGITDDRVRELPLGGTREIAIRSYGGSVGMQVTPALSVGAGLALYAQRLDASFARFNVSSDAFSPPNRSTVTATAVQRGKALSLAPNVGILWSPIVGIRVGAQYRRGPAFDFVQTDDVPLNDVHLVREGRFKVPDVMGAGLEWRLAGRDDQRPDPAYALRVLADYTRVQYSQLKQDFIDIQALVSGRPDRLRIDDGNELHGGLEVFLLKWRGRRLARPIMLRTGAWLDPDHSVRYEPTSAGDPLDILMTATLPGGKDVVHYSFGGGVVLSRRVEMNGAVDVSSRSTFVTTSAVVRF